jgi:hypothetical protein
LFGAVASAEPFAAINPTAACEKMVGMPGDVEASIKKSVRAS